MASEPARLAVSPTRYSLVSGVVRLLRPANLVTSAADVLTGCVIVGGGLDALPWRLVASVALYGGGVVLNDFFDRHLDATERPERPIPSRVVPAAGAASMGFALLAAGVAAGFLASPTTGIIAAVIAAAVVLYDVVAKHNSSGPVVMGACRALNLLLGLAAVPSLLQESWHLALLPLVYVAAITALSRGEVHGGTRRASGMALALFVAVLVALLFVHAGDATGALQSFPFLLLLAMKVAPPLWQAWRDPSAGHVRYAVHAGVVSLIVLDSALAAGFAGVVYGAAILSLIVVAAELARLFPVT